MNMMNAQLELTFAQRNLCPSRVRRQRRLPRARAWFQIMRRVVDRAIDREPLPAPRPVQTVFPVCSREIEIQRQAA